MYFRHLLYIFETFIYLFYQGLGGVTSLVNAVTEYTNAFNEIIDDELSLVVAKKNVGTFLNSAV